MTFYSEFCTKRSEKKKRSLDNRLTFEFGYTVGWIDTFYACRVDTKNYVVNYIDADIAS